MFRRTALLSLQEGIYKRLSTDSAINAKGVKVLDNVPETKPFPYIEIGEDTVNDWSTKLEFGEEVTHTLHIWSQHGGKKEAKEIMNLILQSLSQPLSLDDGFSIEFSKLDFMEVYNDPDKITRHGVIRFRFKISQ
ncbi:DUF3168 domain-containing protein [Peribacillus simplex]|uniref:DUF3168 domain-containing protein n=2 Tax=Peribacillus TaxID=2675229 RepID=A0AA90SWL9_9BACI|nr:MULTISPECIES: DUF3168 domain-containing protein [Peribacillus]MDP1419232.1 DUF3168 domain-containing protein [Peribacillus simplex]MDP1452130.1 DUF3168 domain-containing protein [Peribacillus frigoritolerans]